MPAARNGDLRTQVLIAVWLGVAHWSNPSPRKLPGVTGLVPAVAVGARSAGAATRPPRPVANRVTTIVEDREKRRSIEISSRNCRKNCVYLTPTFTPVTGV